MHHGFTRALAAFLFLAFGLACANEMTAEQARSKIDELGVPFDEEGIVGAIGSGDNELLRLFLLAGFDPDRRQESTPAPLELAAAREISCHEDAGESPVHGQWGLGEVHGPDASGDLPSQRRDE